jgi:PII-like signaling protein
VDVPIVIECIDTDDKIRGIVPELDRMIGGGVITLERVRIVLYR